MAQKQQRVSSFGIKKSSFAESFFLRLFCNIVELSVLYYKKIEFNQHASKIFNMGRDHLKTLNYRPTRHKWQAHWLYALNLSSCIFLKTNKDSCMCSKIYNLEFHCKVSKNQSSLLHFVDLLDEILTEVFLEMLSHMVITYLYINFMIIKKP